MDEFNSQVIYNEYRQRLLEKKPEIFTHPERRENEVWLGNFDVDTFNTYTRFKNKRLGEVPFDFMEQTVSKEAQKAGLKPMFVDVDEYIANMPEDETL